MSIINYRRFDHKIQSSYLLQLVIFNIYFATVQYDIQKKDYLNFYINFNKIFSSSLCFYIIFSIIHITVSNPPLSKTLIIKCSGSIT